MLECVISGSRSDPWTLPRMQPQFSHLLPLNQNNLNRRGPLWNGKIYDEPPRNSMGKLHTNLNWKKVKILSTFRCWFPLIPFISKPHLLTNGDVYNPEKLVPLGTQDTWRTQTKQHRKLKRSATAKCWTKLIANMHRKHNTTWVVRSISKKSSPLKPFSQMKHNLVGSMYRKNPYKDCSFCPDPSTNMAPYAIFVSGWSSCLFEDSCRIVFSVHVCY
jgi:hypothetical protein